MHSITVDDTTPTAGQAITVTLKTCRPGTIALIGVDLALVGSPKVGSDGVARATVTVPRNLRPGRHTVSGLCVTSDWKPLFLTTTITVVAGSTGGGGGGTGGGGGAATPPDGGGTGTAAAPAAATSGVGSGAGAAGGAGTGSGSHIPSGSLAGLDGPTVPADAPVLFEEAAEANGVTEGGAPALATAERSGAGAGGSPGALSTVARVALGVAALGGVPVALAVSRRPQRVVRRGFV
ncbi:MAG TPA: hypothetical protein VF015_12935 [Acidimicrobiales bacterium]